MVKFSIFYNEKCDNKAVFIQFMALFFPTKISEIKVDRLIWSNQFKNNCLWMMSKWKGKIKSKVFLLLWSYVLNNFYNSPLLNDCHFLSLFSFSGIWVLGWNIREGSKFNYRQFGVLFGKTETQLFKVFSEHCQCAGPSENFTWCYY